MKAVNRNLLSAVDLSRKLLFLADKGDMQREDPGCGVLYGVIRDSAYKMKEAAELEILDHKNKSEWDETDEGQGDTPDRAGDA